MGATLSLQAPHAQTVAVRSYVDVLQEYQFLEIINNTRLLKSIKVYHPKTRTLMVMKVFIKPRQTIVLDEVIFKINHEAELLQPYANILGWNKTIETDSAGYLVRQLARTNLYDRMCMAPFPTPAEKLWFVYQLLRILAIVHEQCGIVHGDLKTENLLVTGGNWLLLTDFSDHIKPRVLPENNPSEYAFYFDSSNRRTCYLAPERFYTGVAPEQALLPAQDLFSFGCVVMELYRNGEPTFTLSDLYKYKKGEFVVDASALPRPVQDMVQACLSLEAEHRPSAHSLLQSPAFPPCFDSYLYGFLYDVNTARFESHDPNKSASDLRIEHIWAEFGHLSSALGVDYAKDVPCSPAPRQRFPHYRLALPGMQAYRVRAQAVPNDGFLIVLNTVLSLACTLRRPDNKIKACELILALSERVPDDAKLDRSVPYLCQFFDDFLVQVSQNVEKPEADATFLGPCPASSRVASVALVCLTNLLETCTSVSSINGHVFSGYIFPKLRAVAFRNSQYYEELDHLKKTLAQCFPYLVSISARFDGLSRKERKERKEQHTRKENEPRKDGTRNRDICRKDETKNRDPCRKDELNSRDPCRKDETSDITHITEVLLTSPNVDIRICLVNNILPLCQYLGVDKTNDVVLPHLITYLNDSSYQLRLAFLSSLIEIGNFIGILAFEQYLIPLLLQTLGDHEALVVLKALEIFVFFIQKKHIMAEFNALSIYKELLRSSLPLLVQPNEWIRQSVLCLVLAVADNLQDADKFCFLYPLIKTYLSYDISEITWDSVYPCLVKPLSLQVFELALTWLSKSTPKSMFWKQKNVSIVQTNGKKKLVSYTKDMGKSVYIGTAYESASTDLPLSSEDRTWVLKLKSVGMDVKDLWKVFALKDFLLGISRSRSYSETGHQRNFELASTMNIAPKTVFFNVRYKSEPITKKGKEIHQKSGPSSLVLPKKASASLSTSEANAFGEIDSVQDATTPLDERGITKMFSISNDKIITSTMSHNFGGSNPYILQFLENMEFQPTLDDFSEFGPPAKSPKDLPTISPVQGRLLARFKNNANSNNIEAVTKVATAPFSEYFVSGSETGILRVWNANKVESLSSNSAKLSLDLGSCITEIAFMSQRGVFAASTIRGKIGLFRVEILRGKNRKIVKFSKILSIREFFVHGYATELSFVEYEEKTLLVALTTQCHVVAFDVVTSKKEFELENPPVYGIPETSVSTADWLLLGTREGVLCLWDLRFQILISAWRLNGESGEKAPIRKLVLVPNEKKGSKDPMFAMIGGIDEPDVTLWQIPEFECRQVLSCAAPKITAYRLQKIDKEPPLSELFADFSLDLEPRLQSANTCLVSAGKELCHLVAATADRRLVVWDLQNVHDSVSIPPNSTFFRNQVSNVFSVSHEKTEKAEKSEPPPFEDDISTIAVLTRGHEIVVAGDRSGTLAVYA